MRMPSIEGAEILVGQGGRIRASTVVSHIEGGESGVGVREHGVNSGVAVYAAPPSAGLPHAVEHPAYRQGVPAVADGRHPSRPRGGRRLRRGGSGRAPRGPQAAWEGRRRRGCRRDGARCGGRHGTSVRASARATEAEGEGIRRCWPTGLELSLGLFRLLGSSSGGKIVLLYFLGFLETGTRLIATTAWLLWLWTTRCS